MPARLESFFLRKTSTAQLQLDALDGLRGVAVLIVVLSHLNNAKLFLIPGIDFRGTGKYGVFLFFVLSAFLLTRPLLGASSPLADVRGWARYALRRALRVLPLYWLVLTVNWAVTRWAPTPAMPSLSTEEFIRHLLFLEGKGVYWTIPVECSYYLVLPFVALAYRALRLDPLRVSLITAAKIGAVLWLWPPSEAPRDTLQLGFYLPIFLLGSYTAFLERHFLAEPVAAGRRRLVAVGSLGALVGVALLSPAGGSALLAETVPKTWMHREFLAFGVLWSTVLVGALHAGGPLTALLSSRWLRLVGVVSFSVYLWHVPVARSIVLWNLPNPYATAWLVVIASVAVGMVSFALVEWPLTRSAAIQRLFARLGAR